MSNEIMRNEIIVTVAKGGTKLSLNGNKTYLREILLRSFPNLAFGYATSSEDDYTIYVRSSNGLEMEIEHNEVNDCDGQNPDLTASDIIAKISGVYVRVRDWYYSLPESTDSVTLAIIE